MKACLRGVVLLLLLPLSTNGVAMVVSSVVLGAPDISVRPVATGSPSDTPAPRPCSRPPVTVSASVSKAVDATQRPSGQCKEGT